ncbi:MAG: AzlD domain-containing protein [SAR324 cluster bacterium]|nr:AzlD domain-containing protein [SAR324 cluster bacterium]
MDQKLIFFTILGMTLVTFVPRFLPLFFLANRSLPSIVQRWLSYVPSAVLAAMLFPSLFVKDKQVLLSFDNLYLMAAIPTFLVAFKSKSLFGTVITGMLLVASVRFLLGP